MTRCDARINRRLGVSAAGFPEMRDERCGQTVGVTEWVDALGRSRAACSWHFNQVAQQEHREGELVRARHEYEEDCRVNAWAGYPREVTV